MPKLKEEISSYLPYYIACLVAYYVLPNTLFFFPNEREGFGYFIVNYMIVMPLTCLVTGIIYGSRHGFKLLFPIGTGILFLLSKFFLRYMDSGFHLLAFIFSIVSLIGCAAGAMFKSMHFDKNKHEKD